MSEQTTLAQSISKHGYAARGHKRLSEYNIWCGIRNRTSNPTNKSYSYYGGRGIKLSLEFQESFPAFLAEVGPRPSSSHSLDRIDPDKGYEKGNMRWATPTIQNRNHRDTKLTPEICQEIRELRGIETGRSIAKRFGISSSMVSHVQLGKQWISEGADPKTDRSQANMEVAP